MQDKVINPSTKPRWKKVLFYIFILIVIIPPIIFGVMIGYFFIDQEIDKIHDRKSIMAAADEINPPSGYMQKESEYIDYSCLDVCANLETTYKREGEGRIADIKEFGKSLESKGFKYKDESYTKRFDNQDVDVTLSTYEWDSSIVHIRIEIDSDYLNYLN